MATIEFRGLHFLPLATYELLDPVLFFRSVVPTYDRLIKYLEYKVNCLKAGRLSKFYDEWKSLTSDVEILDMVAGQRQEFTQQPFQLFVPQERKTWDSDQTQTYEVEVQSLLKKDAKGSY